MCEYNISLNGLWMMDYHSNAPYWSQEEPQPVPEDAVSTPVPGYWEDMTGLFRTTALHTKLHWNPLYTLQQYPQAGYVPDMELPNPVGCFLYQRTVRLDYVPEGECELYIGGAQNTVSAWVNGKYLGRHEGYCAPFGFEVPTDVLRAGENRITLAVSNLRLIGYMGRPVSGLTSRAANECTGGIYGDVQLRTRPDGLRDIWVTTAKDHATFTVHTAGGEDKCRTVQIFDGGTCLYAAQIPVGQNCCTMDARDFSLWSPDEPRRYTAVVSTQRQRLTQNFGIRRLTVAGTKLLLNGEPWLFRGTCEHCYQPMTVHPTRDKRYYRMVIRRLKELGFNAIRFHTWVPPREYLEAADELGMVLEVESPNNTSLDEWQEIVRFCRHYTSVNLYSTGNELQIDADYEAHLEACAGLVHSQTDSLFSPMSAMRGIEYHFEDSEYVETPFRHNPGRLARVSEYCDVYNSYSLGLTSYSSALGTQAVLEERNAIYAKPLLSHEICIHGTYIDLSLEERYEGSRIGETRFMSSVRRHLREKGLLDRAPVYFRNSAVWQQLLRKQCFETVRRCDSFAGYDFLGDIDTHWHTFGYCVGMMNEFYEMKPGETGDNVKRYNGDTVLLADLPGCVNCDAGSLVQIPLLVSHYGKPIPGARLQICISGRGKVLYRKELRVGAIPRGTVTQLYRLSFRMPKVSQPEKLTLAVRLSGGDTECDNVWELYVFPKTTGPTQKELRENHVVVPRNCDGTLLLDLLSEGKRVVLLDAGPFASVEASWQLSVAGRTNGHLATVIEDHPLLAGFPHEGYCGKPFESMLRGSRSVVMDGTQGPHRPIIDIASSYKNARREGMLFECRVGSGRLLVCTLNLREEDPAACWLKHRILSYAAGPEFEPGQRLTAGQLVSLYAAGPVWEEENANEALNRNDITM